MAVTTTPSPAVDDRVRASINLLMGVRHVSQVALATELGFRQATLSDRLRSRSPFRASEIEAIAVYFTVPIEVIFAGPAACLRFLSDEENGTGTTGPGLSGSWTRPLLGRAVAA